MFEVPKLHCGYDVAGLEPAKRLLELQESLPDACKSCTKLAEFMLAAVDETVTYIDSQHAVDHLNETDAIIPIVTLDVKEVREATVIGGLHRISAKKRSRISVVEPTTKPAAYLGLGQLIAEDDKETALITIEHAKAKIARCQQTNDC